jgi:hypothetical protein
MDGSVKYVIDRIKDKTSKYFFKWKKNKKYIFDLMEEEEIVIINSP